MQKKINGFLADLDSFNDWGDFLVAFKKGLMLIQKLAEILIIASVCWMNRFRVMRS